MVLKLRKALYGLKQVLRAWNHNLDNCLKMIGFNKCDQDQAVYVQGNSTFTLIFGVYVDDQLITGSSEEQIQAFKGHMMHTFEMSDLGLLSTYLGLEVVQEITKIKLSQRSF